MVDKYFFHGTIAQIDEENIMLREELQKTEKLKAVATLAAGMAHEIKNPLTSIKTFTEHIPQKGDDPAFRDKFYKIVGNGKLAVTPSLRDGSRGCSFWLQLEKIIKPPPIITVNKIARHFKSNIILILTRIIVRRRSQVILISR